MKKFTALVAALLLIAMLCTCASAEFTAMVFGKKATAYFGPSTSDKVLGSLSHKTEVTVEAANDGWALVRYNNNNGYMKVSDLISVKPLKTVTAKANTGVYYITMAQFNNCNFSKKLGVAKKGQKLYVHGYKGDNLVVTDANHKFVALIPKTAVD